MTSITLDELETKVRQVITDLALGGEAVAVTLDGTVVATLSAPMEHATADHDHPELSMTAEEVDAFWAPWREVWEIIGDRWPEGVSAVDAVREQRRG